MSVTGSQLIINPGEVPLPTAVAKRGNFLVSITYQDLAALSGTSAVIDLFTVATGYQGVELDHLEVVTPFANLSDTTDNTTPIIVGDAGTTNRYLTTAETNANGSFVNLAYGTGTRYIPTSPNSQVTATVGNLASGKSLANYGQGQVDLYFKITDSRHLD